jgi:hypothetical protein
MIHPNRAHGRLEAIEYHPVALDHPSGNRLKLAGPSRDFSYIFRVRDVASYTAFYPPSCYTHFVMTDIFHT